jgi:molybdopterin-guanine dinucleotide biosynthesis protein A
LAGGKSLRLGREKALEPINNQRLIDRVISVICSICSEIIIVTNQEQYRRLAKENLRATVQVDLIPGKSSLGGIYTGLAYTSTTYNLVVACDMPFLNHALLSYMISLASGYDVVVPKIDKFLEPLHAVYKIDCMTVIEKLIRENKLSVFRLFEYMNTRYVDKDEVNLFDPDHLSFFNVNTKKDLLEAEKISKRFVDAQIINQVSVDDKC